LTVAATHGSPWRYDNFVPVVFAGGELTAQRVYRPMLKLLTTTES
jgi:hypothetical protein